jgi:hypothetical protein
MREAKENILANVMIVSKLTNGWNDTEYKQSIPG